MKVLEWFLAIIKGIMLGLVLLSISVSGTYLRNGCFILINAVNRASLTSTHQVPKLVAETHSTVEEPTGF